MRPTPLSSADQELLTAHLSGPLDTATTKERAYLSKHVAGDTLVVGEDDDRVETYAGVVADVTEREPTTQVANATTTEQVQNADWFSGKEQSFDTVIRSWVEDCWSVLGSSWKSQQARVARTRHPANNVPIENVRLGASGRESVAADSLA